jgi:hypothetical protein
MNAMKKTRMMIGILSAALLLAPARAQEKPSGSSTSDSAPTVVAYRVQVVISEYDGATKVSSLPYTIPVAQMGDPGARDSRGSLRVGIRVPVSTSSKSGESAITYMDVGTNLDVRVKRADAERYGVDLTLERSWLYVRDQSKEGKVEGRPWVPGDPAPNLAPLDHQFRASVGFLLRDGHASETTVATDPDTGRVLKVDVMLTVIK